MSEALCDLIPESEYAERVATLRHSLAAAGHDAALLWGRGGGSVDRCADVRYLTGFYPVFPTIRDVPGVWSDRGLSGLLVTDSEVVLFSDDPDAQHAAFGLTSSVFRSEVNDRTLTGDVLEALRRRPELKNIVIVAADAMSGNHARELLEDEHVGGLTLTWNETLLEEQRLHKSENEVQIMRRAARVAEAALEAGFAASSPGVREADVVGAMIQQVSSHEAAFANAFVYTTPLNGEGEDNRLPTHSARPLQAGDVFTIDITGTYAGYFFDVARSWVVGALPTPEQQHAYDVAKDTVDAIVAEMQPGAQLGEASKKGSELLRAAGVDPNSGEFPARGHGLGLAFEKPWVRDETELVLEPGMVISIEQFVTLNGVGATYERNILVGENGPEDLVAIRDFWAASLEQESN